MSGKKLVTVGFMRRFDAGYQQMRAALECGELGGATLVHCRHRNPSVPEGYTTRNMIDDTAIHEIDICRYLLDEEIVSVRVDAPRSTSHRFEHLRDPLVLVARTASGVLIDDEINVNIQFGYSIECELVMEAGTIRLADQNTIITRDAAGDRHPICRSHIDRFHSAFNQEGSGSVPSSATSTPAPPPGTAMPPPAWSMRPWSPWSRVAVRSRSS